MTARRQTDRQVAAEYASTCRLLDGYAEMARVARKFDMEYEQDRIPRAVDDLTGEAKRLVGDLAARGITPAQALAMA